MDHTNFAVYSAAGNRQINEDCARAEQHGDVSCFVLCDGLGGHGRGEVASGMAVETILSELKDAPSADAEYLAAAMEAAQARLLTDARSAVWAHIGDSRLYLFYKNKIVLRTLDHSVPQMLVLMGEIKEKQIRQHPDRNRLLRVLGCEWGTQRYACSEPRSLEKCQAFLLCSDGFWEFITEKMMCKYLKKSKTAAEWLRMMQEEVQRNGIGADMDNNTAVAVRL